MKLYWISFTQPKIFPVSLKGFCMTSEETDGIGELAETSEDAGSEIMVELSFWHLKFSTN